MALLRTSLTLAFLLVPVNSFAQCEVERLTASDGMPHDWYGISVAIDGVTLAVGAQQLAVDIGRAYVYTQTPFGWGDEVTVTPSDGTFNDLFGHDVALHGDTLVVSASRDDPSGMDSGSAYVFERSGSTWTQTDKLTASDGAQQDEFGEAVALFGDTLFIGAADDDDDGSESGAVYVFERSPTGWIETQKLTASDAAANGRFGRSIGFDGTRVAVAGFGDAYVFEELVGLWTETAHFAPAGGQLVQSIAVDGDTVLAGAPGDCFFSCEPGDAFVFELGPGGWAEVAHFVSSEAPSEQRFGTAVALDGDLALVGARGFYFKGAQFGSGAGHVFERDAGTWTRATKLTSASQLFDDRFGSTVALQGRTAVVGAGNDALFQGAAYVFEILDAALTYCFGLGCPCTNGLSHAGCGNSLSPSSVEKRGGHFSACGSTSATDDDLLLVLKNLPPNQFGLLYMGAGTTEVPFGDGQRCVSAGGAGVFRYPIQNAGPGGTITLGPGIVATTHASFPLEGRISAGQTWNFQGWYRDPAGPCGTGFNLTNAGSVTFGP